MLNLTVLHVADTVVLTHTPLSVHSIPYADATPVAQDILEKPTTKEDNLRMLLDLNGNVCEVVTGVSLGALYTSLCVFA